MSYVLSYVMYCHVMLCYVNWHGKCHIILHVICHFILYGIYHAMSCYMSCQVIYVMFCHVICPCCSFYLDLMTLGWDIVWEKVIRGWVVFVEIKDGSKPINSVLNDGVVALQSTRSWHQKNNFPVTQVWTTVIPRSLQNSNYKQIKTLLNHKILSCSPCTSAKS